MNKFLFLIAVIIFINFQAKSQNIFSNPDFELYSSCPIDQGEVYKATDWVGIIQSPDYMNCSYTCWTGQATVGAQSGTGYMGFASYNPANATEAIAQQLAAPLVAGNTYNISLYAKKTTGPAYTGNCGGVCFYGWIGNPYGASSTVAVCPEDSGGVVLACTDTVYNTAWQPYTVSFVAPDAYDFIGIAVACQFNVGCGQYAFIDNLSMVLSAVEENKAGISGIKVFQSEGLSQLNVSFSLLKSSTVKFSLINLLGEVVMEKQKKILSGLVNEQFNLAAISGGIYFLNIESDAGRFVKKVHISK